LDQGVFYLDKMAKNLFYLILVILLILGAGYFLLGKNNDDPGIIIGEGGEDYQKVVLGIKNYNYYPNTIEVKANQPVRIYLDKSVAGCYRSFTIRELGIAKYLKTPEEYVEFTPTIPGTYGFSCSMGMGRGTMIVK